MARGDAFKLGLEDFGEVLNSVLSPSSAIKTPEFLQGREEQVRDVREALAMKGRHVFLHGFRGVGKTSLAYTTANIIQSSDAKPIYVQCSPEGTLTGLIYDILKQAMPSDPTQIKRMVEANVGVNATVGKFGVSAGMRRAIESGSIPRPESVNDAVELICFAAARHSRRPVVIIDEFDHMNRAEHVQVDLFIKKLAEVDDLPLKLIMCGVGETLESLFAAHLSTYRYFHTIKVDRLKPEPLRAIIDKACMTLGVSMEDTTAWRITRISDGFPHFVHLMCEKIFWAMYNDENDSWMKDGYVGVEHYRKGTRDAVSAANEELRKGYESAVRKYAKNGDAILWAAADGHELQRKVVDMYRSYQRLILSNHQLVEYDPAKDTGPLDHALTEAKFRSRIYNLCREKSDRILTSNGKGWYEYTEKMMRGYARLKAEASGVELFPDHPLIPKASAQLPAESRKIVEV